MIPSIDTSKVIKYLKFYYYLGNKKNIELREAIERIDRTYEEENLIAQMNYEQKKEQRTEVRSKVLYGIGFAIGLILLITTILLLSSIQHYLKELTKT